MPAKTRLIETLTELNVELEGLNDDLENYFRNTIIPQLFVDANLTLKKFTPPAMKQFSLSMNDIGKPIGDIKDNFRFPNIIENIKHVIASNEILEKEIQTTDLRWYQMNIIPYVEKKKNKTNGVIMTFVEITMRIRDLKEQERLISDHEILLDTISHDIKTPLTTLVAAIDLFKNTPIEDSNQYQILLKMVENAIKKMQEIISELTDTRKQEFRYKAEEELVNFEHILEDVRVTLMDDIIKSGAVISSEVNASQIQFSRRKLRSIIYNLVNNAIKYRSPGRKLAITIKTGVEGGFVCISVSDNGTGIEPDKHIAIFSKYFRLKNGLDGSGIGLYLVNEIVQNAGGHISLHSELDKGAEFKIYLRQADLSN